MNYAIKQFGFLRSRKLWAVLGLFVVLAVGQSLWQRPAAAAHNAKVGASTAVACTYTITPASFNLPNPGEFELLNVLVMTQTNCPHAAGSNVGWIKLTSSGSLLGSGLHQFKVETNTGFSARTGTITVAGKLVIVTQPGTSSCTYNVSPTSISFPNNASASFPTVVQTQKGCNAMTAPENSNVSWIKSAYATGSFESWYIYWNVAENLSSSARTGTLTVAGKTVTVMQPGGSCDYAVSPAQVSAPTHQASNISITVTTASSCPWKTVSQANWISVTGGFSEFGSGQAKLSIQENPIPSSRTGTVTVAGKTVTVTQPGNFCNATSVSPASFELTTPSFANLLKVTVDTQPGCAWTTVSNANWIKIDSGINQSGDGVAFFSVTANPNIVSRTGTLTVAGKTVTVTQFGVGCSAITVNPASLPSGTVGSAFSQNFTASGGTAPYKFKILNGALPVGLQLNNNGNLSGTPTTVGTFNFTVSAVDQTDCVGTRTYSLTINPPVCPNLTLTPSTLMAGAVGTAYTQNIAVNGGAAPFTFSVSAGALPPGLQLNGNALSGTPTTNGAYSFTIKATDANGCTGTKQFTINIGCATITLNPAMLPAPTVGTAYSQALSAAGGTAPYTYSVSPGSSLPSGLSLANDVLSGTPTSPTVGHNFSLRVTDANGCLGIRGYLLPVAPAPVVTVSAASYKEGAAPESIVAAFGAKLAATTQVANTQPLPTTLANVSVGITDSAGVNRLAPLFFVSAGQINYLVPQGTALGTATIRVFNGNEMVAAGMLEIDNVAPGLFAANANGQGVASAVALRIKGNGAQSYEPVAQYQNNQFVCQPIDLGPESDQVFLVLYGTGLRYRQNLSVVVTTLGGNVSGEVVFAGAAPGFVGLDQVNVRVPRALIGRGEIDLALMAEGKAANTVRVNVQ